MKGDPMEGSYPWSKPVFKYFPEFGRGGVVVALGFFERIRVLMLEAHPFDLLLEEAEGAAAARPPFVVIGQTEVRRVKQIDHAGLVDAMLPKGIFHFEIGMGGVIAEPFGLIDPDRDIAENSFAAFQMGLKPVLERFEL